MRRLRPTKFVFLLMLFCIYSCFAAASEPLSIVAAPDVIRPGKYYEITIVSQQAGGASILLADENGARIYEIFAEYPLVEGENRLRWDGTRTDESAVEQGEYLFRVAMGDGAAAELPLRIGAPYPMLTHIWQSDAAVGEVPISVDYVATEAGRLTVALKGVLGDNAVTLREEDIAVGANRFEWDGAVNGERLPSGAYALVLALKTSNGAQSMDKHLYVEVAETAEETETPAPDPIEAEMPTPEPEPEPEPTPAPTPTPAPPLFSQPYSDAGDGSYWAMTPGELDDAVIWDILMQPITVYDAADSKGHAYLMENPDGSGAKVAQIHGKSQGLHVIGEKNEHGYVLVEAFSNYDRDYFPSTDEEKAHAFELKRGYVKASGLKQITVMADMALLVDKLTQRMYLFVNGVRVTEFLISTGTYSSDKDLLFETPAGEYITVSHVGAFPSGNMICDMAIRINGGVLLHEVPHKVNKDGTRNYSSFEGYLGTKQSHGCIRIQRLKNAEGYNMRWVWENFKKGAAYKVIIWDDLGRADSPETWQPNPKN